MLLLLLLLLLVVIAWATFKVRLAHPCAAAWLLGLPGEGGAGGVGVQEERTVAASGWLRGEGCRTVGRSTCDNFHSAVSRSQNSQSPVQAAGRAGEGEGGRAGRLAANAATAAKGAEQVQKLKACHDMPAHTHTHTVNLPTI